MPLLLVSSQGSCFETLNANTVVSANLLAVGQGLYAFNRFVASGLISLQAFKPRYILAVYLGLCFVFGLCATLTHGPISVAMLILVLCFESVSALFYETKQYVRFSPT